MNNVKINLNHINADTKAGKAVNETLDKIKNYFANIAQELAENKIEDLKITVKKVGAGYGRSEYHIKLSGSARVM